MFGFEMLDVAIGVVFVYLLLSLICTATNEIVEALLKKRADYLERGIRELVKDLAEGSGKEPKADLVARIYNHPQVAALYSGDYAFSSGSRFSSEKWLSLLPVVAAVRRRRLPTYIPSEHFAKSLLDTIANPNGISFNREKLRQVCRVPGLEQLFERAESTRRSINDGFEAYISNAVPDEAGRKRLTDLLALGDYDGLLDALETTRRANDSGASRDGLACLKKRVNEDLVPLISRAQGSFEEARKEVETWYNNAMDRVAGWYKRRAQVMAFLLGLCVAVYVNADSITVVKRLSHDKGVRDFLIASAQNGGNADPDDKSAKERMLAAKSEIMALGLPIGWRYAGENRDFLHLNQITSKLPLVGFPFESSPFYIEDYPDNNDQLAASALLKILGWLITAVAVSLGAPFWFDLLNKFMVVRSTVKPKEKSRDEGQKD